MGVRSGSDGQPGERPVPGAAPVLDPELADFLAAHPGLTRTLRAEHIGSLRARQRSQDEEWDDVALSRSGAVDVGERRVPVGAGVDRSLLVLSPAGPPRPRPGIYHLHGGGMVAGGNRTGIGPVLDWVTELGVVVLSPDYRLAPEHPHPGPVRDCLAGWDWITGHAGELGVDARAMVLAGTSAGGGLAAALAVICRDRGGPGPAGQVLMSPMLDDRNDSPSARGFDGRTVWDRGSNATGWQALLGAARGTDAVGPAAAPARTRELAGLPPTYLDVGGAETFRDEAIEYGTRLARAGVPVDLHLWAGAFHGFEHFVPDSAVARSARRARTEFLRRLLRGRVPA